VLPAGFSTLTKQNQSINQSINQSNRIKPINQVYLKQQDSQKESMINKNVVLGNEIATMQNSF